MQQDSYHNADDCLKWMSFDQSEQLRSAEGFKDNENSDESNASDHQSKDVAKSDLTDDNHREDVAESSECRDGAERVVAQSMKSWRTSTDFQNHLEMLRASRTKSKWSKNSIAMMLMRT